MSYVCVFVLLFCCCFLALALQYRLQRDEICGLAHSHPLLDIQLPQFVPPSFQSPKTHFAAKPDIELYWYTTNVLYYTWGLPDTHQSDPIAALSNSDSSEVSPRTEL